MEQRNCVVLVMKTNLSLVVLCTLPLLFAPSSASAAEALPVVVEIEPNDEPHLGLPFTAPAMLSGAMPAAGDQDAYRLQTSDAAAQQLWTLKLTGMPDALTGVSLFRLENDATGKQVLEKTKLLTFGIRDGSRSVEYKEILLPAGETIVGMFGTGQGGGFRPPGSNTASITQALSGDDTKVAIQATPASYRFSVQKAGNLRFTGASENVSQDKAFPLRLNSRQGNIMAGSSWYRLQIPEDSQRITINAGITLGHSIRLTLTDQSGVEVSQSNSDRIGQARLPNLALASGTYTLEVEDSSKLGSIPTVRWARWQVVGQVAEGEEREPNDKWSEATATDITTPVTGRFDKARDADFYRFSLSEDTANTSYDLELNSTELQSLTLCLTDALGKDRQCRSGSPPLKLAGLSLNSGDHGVRAARNNDTGVYTLTLTKNSALPASSELEPNDLAADATVFGKRRLIKGALSKQDTDHFVLLTTCLLYTSPSPRDRTRSRMPSSA